MSFLSAEAAGAGSASMLVMLALMFAVFYFFFIRPENKKKKTVEEMRNALTVGDEITTIGAMTGKLGNIPGITVKSALTAKKTAAADPE